MQVSTLSLIAPVDGWSIELDEREPHGRWHEYKAVRGDEVRYLGVSRFDFTPTQDRFAWLVANDFPASIGRVTGIRTPICNDDIDAALAMQVAA